MFCSVCVSRVGMSLRWADSSSEESYLFCVTFGGLEVNSELECDVGSDLLRLNCI